MSDMTSKNISSNNHDAGEVSVTDTDPLKISGGGGPGTQRI